MHIYPFMGELCVYICACSSPVLIWEAHGTFQGILCKYDQFLHILLLSLFFHHLAQLQRVLQTQNSMRELHFPLSSSRAITQLAILCRSINIVLDWSYPFLLSSQFRRQVTSIADELVNPGHFHGSYYFCYLLSVSNNHWFGSLFKAKYNFWEQ